MLSDADMFSSVFPTALPFHSKPTPLSTPVIGASSSFGVSASPSKQLSTSSAAQTQIKRNLAWSTATRYLSLEGLTLEELDKPKNIVTRKRKSREVEEALELLLSGLGNHGQTDEEWDLVGDQGV